MAHPLTGVVERLHLTRELLLGLVRAPLYSPLLASALPHALSDAARGRFEPLVGLASGLQGARANSLSEGMHFSVVCAEDLPRMAPAAGAGAAAASAPFTPSVSSAAAAAVANAAARLDAPGRDFASFFADQYRAICAGWPRGEVPAAFYSVAPAPAAALLLSGGADPVTPPRHGERVAKALGPRARHIVVGAAGHGVMALPCMRDVLYRFIAAADDEAALQVKADCAGAVPRPPAFVPPGAAGVGSGS